MKKTKDYTLLALAIPLAIAILANLPGCYADNKKQGECRQKYVIDLPEEISQSAGNDLEAFKRNDTIFIQFKNK